MEGGNRRGPWCALAGGVGGARLAFGLQRVGGGDVSVVINTADDFKIYGLHVSPDVDTVMYTLAGLANAATGWGVRDETWQAMDMLRRYGDDAWFSLGDRDLGTHMLRTTRLQSGESLTSITLDLADTLGVRARLLPMCDEAVTTEVQTPAGLLSFQDYFVRRHHQDDVLQVRFQGVESARVTEDVQRAVQQARGIIFCPSNPLVSIGPILAVPGMQTLLEQAPGPRVAVSPLIGGLALKGPADRMMQTLGYEASAFGVARLYQGLMDGFVIDLEDAALAPRIQALGMRVLVTQTIMRTDEDRIHLAEEVMDFCASLQESRIPVALGQAEK